MRDESRLARVAGWCGVASPSISFSLILYAAGVSPWFNWHLNSLSDLGVKGSTAFFNSATMVGGLLAFVLILGLVRVSRLGRVGQAGCLCALVGTAGLSLVGVFPKDRGTIHIAVAVTYFLATPLGYLLVGLGLIERRRPLSGALTVSAGLAALLLITRTPHDGYAVPEMLAALVMGGWVFAMGMALLIQPPASDPQAQWLR